MGAPNELAVAIVLTLTIASTILGVGNAFSRTGQSSRPQRDPEQQRCPGLINFDIPAFYYIVSPIAPETVGAARYNIPAYREVTHYANGRCCVASVALRSHFLCIRALRVYTTLLNWRGLAYVLRVRATFIKR